MKIPCFRSVLLAATIAFAPGTGALAATTTSGCASASSCTLAELFAGGSIQVDDLQLSNVVFDAAQSLSIPMLDTSSISISADSAGRTGFNLDFGNKTTTVNEFVGLVFDFSLAVIGTSRNIVSASLDNWDRARTGDAMNTNIELRADFVPLLAAPILNVIDDFFSPLQETDTEAMGPTMSASGEFFWGQNVFGASTADSITARSVDLSFGFDRRLPPPTPTVPLPAGGLLLLGGLGLLALGRRRKS